MTRKALLLVLLVFLGCRSETVSNTFDSLTNQIKPAKENVEKATREEIEKLSILEYRVAEFPLALSAAELEGELAKLGRDRWECFHALHQETTIRFFCKRHPKSYLRYIPKVF